MCTRRRCALRARTSTVHGQRRNPAARPLPRRQASPHDLSQFGAPIVGYCATGSKCVIDKQAITPPKRPSVRIRLFNTARHSTAAALHELCSLKTAATTGRSGPAEWIQRSGPPQPGEPPLLGVDSLGSISQRGTRLARERNTVVGTLMSDLFKPWVQAKPTIESCLTFLIVTFV